MYLSSKMFRDTRSPGRYVVPKGKTGDTNITESIVLLTGEPKLY